MVVKSGSIDKEVGPKDGDLSLQLSELTDSATVSEITTYDNTITTRENELATAKAIFENDKNQNNRKALKTAEDNLKTAKKSER